MTSEEITESYNRVYGPRGGEDPETREFRREAARRAFERSEWDGEIPGSLRQPDHPK